ncbi:unnamed protein product, partial [Amoebophrya sp. A25]
LFKGAEGARSSSPGRATRSPIYFGNENGARAPTSGGSQNVDGQRNRRTLFSVDVEASGDQELIDEQDTDRETAFLERVATGQQQQQTLWAAGQGAGPAGGAGGKRGPSPAPPGAPGGPKGAPAGPKAAPGSGAPSGAPGTPLGDADDDSGDESSPNHGAAGGSGGGRTQDPLRVIDPQIIAEGTFLVHFGAPGWVVIYAFISITGLLIVLRLTVCRTRFEIPKSERAQRAQHAVEIAAETVELGKRPGTIRKQYLLQKGYIRSAVGYGG